MFEALTKPCPSWLLVISTVLVAVVVVVGVVVVVVLDGLGVVVVGGRGAVVVPVGGALGTVGVGCSVVVVVDFGSGLLVVVGLPVDFAVVPRFALGVVVVVVLRGPVPVEGEPARDTVVVVEGPGTPPAAPIGIPEVVPERPGRVDPLARATEGALDVPPWPDGGPPGLTVVVVVLERPVATVTGLRLPVVVVVLVVLVVVDREPEGRVAREPVKGWEELPPALLVGGVGARVVWNANACTALPPLPPAFAKSGISGECGAPPVASRAGAAAT